MYALRSLSLALAALVATPLPVLSDAVPTFAPVPPTSNGPDLGTKGYFVESFGGGAYMLSEGQYQVLFLVSTKGVIVVDAPPTIGHKIFYGIANTTSQPITHLVYSHAHTDHIGAAYLFGKDVQIVAHALTADILRTPPAAPDPKRPLPHVVFAGAHHTLTVGNQTLELAYKGLAHQPGNIYIYAPHQKVLMLVDIVFPGWAPFAYLGAAQYVPGYMAAYDHALSYDFSHLVAGHLTRSGTRQDVLTGREYVRDLHDNCKAAIGLSALPPNASNNPISAAALLGPVGLANPGNPWALFRVYLDAVRDYCHNVTAEKWLGKIGAVDVFGPSNAYIMVESLRIDFDVLGPFSVSD